MGCKAEALTRRCRVSAFVFCEWWCAVCELFVEKLGFALGWEGGDVGGRFDLRCSLRKR